jgi:calcium release-activated calcium channel protein 1
MAAIAGAAALGLTALDTAIGKSSHDATMEVRLVDEKVQQLKAISNLSALIGGFAMVSIVELNMTPDHPQLLMFAFGTMAATVIALMMFSMVSARAPAGPAAKPILTASLPIASRARQVLCSLIMVYILNYRTMHHRAFDLIAWNSRCEADWRRAFSAFKTGVPCFLLNLSLLAWVQFKDYKAAAVSVTVISLVAVFIWLWYVNVKWATQVR